MALGGREIDRPVDLCLPDGRVNPAALGWSRRPLHRANLRGWGRTKRWEYWAIITPRYAISLTAASADYAGLYGLYVLDRATDTVTAADTLAPFALGARFSPEAPRANGRGARQVSVRTRRMSIVTDELGDAGTGTTGTWVRASAGSLGLDLTMPCPPGHEALATVASWSSRRFQYSVKDVARPVGGVIRLGGITDTIDPGSGVAILDHGRGRWPYRSAWNWAAGGAPDGKSGIQLGGSWSGATGGSDSQADAPFSDNALLHHGRIQPIAERLAWGYDRHDWMLPWAISGERVQARFHPFHVHRTQLNLGVVALRICRAFGTFSGRARAETGEWVDLDGLSGVAEEARHRW